MPADEPLRFTDILTTAAAVADYLAADAVTAEHVAAAVSLLRGEQTYEDLGRGRVPLGHRPPGGAPVEPGVRAIVQRWFHQLGDDPAAELSASDTSRFIAELAMAQRDDPPRP
jgi:hypothetical protein